jgi:hypothetical protein
VVSAKRQPPADRSLARAAEGNHVPATVSVEGIADARGAVGPASGEVPLASIVGDPGAVVTGRVLNGDGSPLPPGVVVYYLADGAWQPLQCVGAIAKAISAVEVDESGAFELRYVRQSLCGIPFELLTRDPANGAVTKVSGRVRADGERIVMDIALLAKGSVVGTVSRYVAAGSLQKQPVPGAVVRVFSETETQSFGEAVTDGDGRYRVDGITVGRGGARRPGAGRVGSGRGVRPSRHARRRGRRLDDNAVRVSGGVEGRPQQPDFEARTSVVPGIQVLYTPARSSWAKTDVTGTYVFEHAGRCLHGRRRSTRATGQVASTPGSRRLTVDLTIEIAGVRPELGR